MVHPIIALASPEIIAILIIGAVVLFGAEKLPKLARSAGAAKKEFMMGQAEADEAAARAREQARIREESAKNDVMNNVSGTSFNGEDIPKPTPDKGTLSS
jgi:sec-independent protein translocase protein TatA